MKTTKLFILFTLFIGAAFVLTIQTILVHEKLTSSLLQSVREYALSPSSQRSQSTNPTVLIAISTSRPEVLRTNVPTATIQTIARTWVRTAEYHPLKFSRNSSVYRPNIRVVYFVGNSSIDDKDDPIHEQALMNGVRNVIVLNTDAGANSTARQTAMLKALADMSSSPSSFDWIYIVDDQTHVNTNNLLRFVRDHQLNALSSPPRTTTTYQIDKGKSAATSAHFFCGKHLHQGGVLFWRPALLELVDNIDQCELIPRRKPFVPACVRFVLKKQCSNLPVVDDATPQNKRQLNETTAICISRVRVMRRFVELHTLTQQFEESQSSSAASIVTRGTFHDEVDTDVYIAPWRYALHPRAYAFGTMNSLFLDYGIGSNKVKSNVANVLQSSLKWHLCQSLEASTSRRGGEKARCGRKKIKGIFDLDIRQCMNCPSSSYYNGLWHVAFSPYGILNTRIDEQGQEILAAERADRREVKTIDIMIPVRNEKDKIIRFVELLSNSSIQFNEFEMGRGIQVRVIISSYGNDEWLASGAYLKDTANATAASALQIVLADCGFGAEIFERGHAANCCMKKACSKRSCIAALIDVDLSVGAKFLRRAMAFVYPSATVYFPLMFSLYNPETVELANRELATDKLLRKLSAWQNTNHDGFYRTISYGMWAMAGSDLARFRFKNSFKGWGGEDEDFYELVSAHLNVVRMADPGLVHIWHPKNCDFGDFVTSGRNMKSCNNSRDRLEGSTLGYYLLSQKKKNNISYAENNGYGSEA